MLCRMDSVSLTEFAMLKGKPVLPMIAFGVNLKLTSSIGMVCLYVPKPNKLMGIIYSATDFSYTPLRT